MGASVQAKIFYGYLWTDEDDELALGDFAEGNALEGQDIDEWPKFIAVRRGHVNPWDAFTESTEETYAQRTAENEAWIAANEAELDAWWKVNKDIETEFGVAFDSHGHCNYSARHLTAVGSECAVESTDGFDLGTSARGLACSPDDVILANNISQFVRSFIEGSAQLGTKAVRDLAAQDTEGARGSAIMLAQLCGRLYEGGYDTLNHVAIDVLHVVTGVLAHYTNKATRPKHLHGG